MDFEEGFHSLLRDVSTQTPLFDDFYKILFELLNDEFCNHYFFIFNINLIFIIILDK
jgi:hypothetical protein